MSATRDDEETFWARAPLGLSLRRLESDGRISHSIAFENRIGLGEIYNLRINASTTDDVLVFVHDDVWIDDFFIADRVTEGLDRFDIIGVAGNRRRVAHQGSWFLVYDSEGKPVRDSFTNLSGSIAHGALATGGVERYGDVPAACELLDGVLLATRRSTLTRTGVFFDPFFTFHFYDMDFCRAARANRLQLGTWPLAITHQSSGAGGGGGIEWQKAFAEYLEKWKE